MSAPYTLHYGYCAEQTAKADNLDTLIAEALAIIDDPAPRGAYWVHPSAGQIFGDDYDGPEDWSNGLTEDEREQIEAAGL